MKNLSLSVLLIFFSLISFSQNLTPICNSKGQYGFVDENSDTVIACQYEYAEDFSNGLALVKNNMQFMLLDTSGIHRELEEAEPNGEIRYELGTDHSGLPLIVRVWECAYINLIGEVSLEIPYQDACSFVDAKAKVIDGDKYNYINRNGILMSQWQYIEDDYRPIKYKDKYGYIDRNGKLVIEYQYLGARDFKDGYGQVYDGQFWSLINKTGKIISDGYEVIHDFDGEIALVQKIGNYGFINSDGRFVGKWYSNIELLGFGLYKAFKYETFAVVNQKGVIVTDWFDEIYEFDGHFLKVRKEEKYAYLNDIGALAIGWYDEISDIQDGIIIVKNDEKYAFYNINNFYISNWYNYMSSFSEGLAVITDENNKYAFIDKNGIIELGFQYDYAEPFVNGLAVVEKDNKVAYIQKSGKPLIGWRDKIEYFNSSPPQGIIAVKYGTKYGYETINGKRIITAKYDWADNFYEDVALVKTNFRYMLIDLKGNLKELDSYPTDSLTTRLDWGNGHTGKPVKVGVWDCEFINYDGRTVLELPYSDAFSFRDGKAKVINGDKYNYIDHEGTLLGEWVDLVDNYHAVIENGKFGYIDKNNKLIIPHQFNYAKDFHDGIAIIRKGSRRTGKYAIINKTGMLISDLYDEILDYKNFTAKVRNIDKFGLIDTSGALLTVEWYDEIKDYQEGFAVVKKNEKYAYINKNGKLISGWFLDAYNFSNKRAKVLGENGWGYINYKGEIKIPTIYCQVWDFENNVAKVERDGKYAFINIKGEIITDWYDRMFGFSEGMAVVCKEKKWGYININGELAIECKYQRAFAFYQGTGFVIENGERKTINKEGEIIEN